MFFCLLQSMCAPLQRRRKKRSIVHGSQIQDSDHSHARAVSSTALPTIYILHCPIRVWNKRLHYLAHAIEPPNKHGENHSKSSLTFLSMSLRLKKLLIGSF